MKSGILAVCALCAIGATFANASDDAKKAERRHKMLVATGGMAEKPGTGRIVVLNAQAKVPKSAIQGVVEKLVHQTKFNVEIVDGKYAMYVRPEGAEAAVVLADDPALPLSVVAVENLWGLVNVAKLGDHKTESRFTKEFIRVTTLAFGGALSRFTGSPLSSAANAEMLDRYPTENYTYDCQQAILKNLCNLGMAPRLRTSYKKACEEGWAPAPTNDIQKAIWDRVHATPKNPIKIEFDPKKGR